jgi:hypothetical protein
MSNDSSIFYGDRKKQVARGALAVKARWAADEERIKLDVVLGSPNDLTNYQDYLESARIAGSTMNAAEKQRARELSRNPK